MRDPKLKEAFSAAAGDITRRRPKPPPRRRHGALVAELWRGHHRRVFVHQFRQLAARRPPELPRQALQANTAYSYRHRFGSPSQGLVAAKHAQAEESRQRAREDFRFNAELRGKARAQHRGSVILNEVSKVDRMNADEMRARARTGFAAGRKLQQRTLAELCQLHLQQGTLAQFLRSLKHG